MCVYVCVYDSRGGGRQSCDEEQCELAAGQICNTEKQPEHSGFGEDQANGKRSVTSHEAIERAVKKLLQETER
jgi:hypothetical protein